MLRRVSDSDMVVQAEDKRIVTISLARVTAYLIVEALRDGELSAGKLIEKLGLEQANAPQHLAVLRNKQSY